MENWNQKLISEEEGKIGKNKNANSKGNPLWDSMKDETNVTRTENDALTFKSTKSCVLDFFSMGGALRTRKPEEIDQMVSKAISEDKLLGIKCLFYIRDIRGGQGERRTFREGLKVLSTNYPEETKKLISLIPEYGRWDDVFSLENVDFKEFLLNTLNNDSAKDNKHISLLGKWMPSENSSSKKTIAKARALRKYLGLSSKKYRKLLAELRTKIGIIESNLSKKDYTFLYEKVPSKASLKYKKAFERNDKKRYDKYLELVEKGETKINTKTLFPYEIVREARKENNKTLELMWKNLPDYTKADEKALVVADTSGSMEGNPLDIAVSLAMYFGERNNGIFQNKFITFSQNPTLQDIKGANLHQKILNLDKAQWDGNTDLQKVFDLILNTALKNKVDKKDMPGTIYIISDMEFDRATRDYESDEETNFNAIKKKYEKAGYELPQLVFWNVDSRQDNVPVKQDERGVILVSGSSPVVFKMVCEKTTPYEFMVKTLNSERYKIIEEKLR